MGVQENLDIVRKGYAAFSSGDVETLAGLFGDDPVHSVPGSSPIAGDHKGVQDILQMYGRLGELSAGSMKVELESVMSDGGNQVVAVHTSTAEREGRSLQQREALLFTIEDGKISSIQDFFPDIEEQDRFWS
jgi:ketosteroid isomerase-like protein